jgi:hypothetical protein
MDSLYFIIAATALGSGMVPGAALSYPFGITSIMNRIVMSPYGFLILSPAFRMRTQALFRRRTSGGWIDRLYSFFPGAISRVPEQIDPRYHEQGSDEAT